MRVLKIVGLVEHYGEGIDRMYREMESRLLAPPVFTATASSVTVTLYHHSVVDVEDQLWLQALETEQLTTDGSHYPPPTAHGRSGSTRRGRRVADSDAAPAGSAQY